MQDSTGVMCMEYHSSDFQVQSLDCQSYLNECYMYHLSGFCIPYSDR